MKIITAIYRSPRKPGLYLYLNKSKGLDCLPEALLEKFGQPEHSMTLLLTPEKKLARVDIDSVLASLNGQGYYLQLPPAHDEYMQGINQHNDKLSLG